MVQSDTIIRKEGSEVGKERKRIQGEREEIQYAPFLTDYSGE